MARDSASIPSGVTRRALPLFGTGGRVLGVALLVVAGMVVSAGHAVMLFVLACGVALFVLAALRPKTMLWLVIVGTILMPGYIRVGVPGLPLLPASLALTLVLALPLLLEYGLTRGGKPADPISSVGWMYLFLGAITLVSMIDPLTSVGSVTWWIKAYLAPALLYLILRHLLNSTADLTRLMQILTAACVFCVIYAVAEFITGKNFVLTTFLRDYPDLDGLPLEREDFDVYGEIHRVYSLFGSPIDFGVALSMVFPYTLLRLADTATPRARALWLAVAALMVLGVGLSFSRGPMLALILCVIALAIIVKPIRRYAVIGCVVAALAVMAAWPWIGEKLEARTVGTENILIRLKLWRIAAGMIEDHPVLGVGFGNYVEYRTETLVRHRININDTVWAERVLTVDNTFLHLAAEGGVFALLAFVGLFTLYFKLSFNLYLRAPTGPPRTLILASGGAALAFLVNALTGTMYAGYTLPIVMSMFFAIPLILQARCLPTAR